MHDNYESIFKKSVEIQGKISTSCSAYIFPKSLKYYILHYIGKINLCANERVAIFSAVSTLSLRIAKHTGASVSSDWRLALQTVN